MASRFRISDSGLVIDTRESEWLGSSVRRTDESGAGKSLDQPVRGGDEFPETPDQSQHAEDPDDDSGEALMAFPCQGIDAQREQDRAPDVFQ